MKASKLQPKPLSCSQCGRNFVLDACLAAHKTIEHQQRPPHRCGVCGLSFFSAQAFNQHIMAHSLARRSPASSPSSSSSYKCSECALEFPSVHGLRVHVSQHTGLSRNTLLKTSGTSQFITCRFCPAILSGKKRYKEHLKIHETVRPFECQQCHVSFRMQSQLLVHQKRHLELRDLPPDALQRYFAQIPGGSIKMAVEETEED